MAGSVPFTEHEAVLLLDGYLETIASNDSKKHTIKRISNDLRKMAVNNGQSIDSIFRNENGISFQMARMESAYQGRTIRVPATKLFLEISELYKNNYEKYFKILQEAKSMVEGKNKIAEQYASWLAEKVSPAQLSELYFCYQNIEDYCLKNKILTQPLFETTDLSTIKNVQQFVTEDRTFQLRNKKQMKVILSAARYYFLFIKEINEKAANEKQNRNELYNSNVVESVKSKPETINSRNLIRNVTDRTLYEKYPILFKKIFNILSKHNEPLSAENLQSEIGMFFRITDILTILMQASWAKECTGGNYQYVQDSIEQEKTVASKPITKATIEETTVEYKPSIVSKPTIKFTEERPMMFTKPMKVTYCNDDLGSVSSWKDVYVKLVEALYNDYPNAIPVNCSFSGSERPDFGDETIAKLMVAPKHITKNLYLETNHSATGIIKKIKTLLDICHVDYKNIVIKYDSKNQKDNSTAIPVKKNDLPNTSLAPSSNDYYDYLSNVVHMAEATCRSYSRAIQSVEQYSQEHGYIQTRIYGQPTESVCALFNQLFQDKNFLEYNTQQHNRFRAAINKMLDYMNNKEMPGLHTGVRKVKSNCSSTSDYEKVLEERFVKGFKLGSPLEIRRFRLYYEELNGKALSMEDSEIERIIRSCGIVHDEKLFMPTTMLSEDIKKKLLCYISDTFKSGKVSIYYKALYTEFSEDFLNHIYNAEMLKSYLTYVNDGSYYIGRNQIMKEAGITSYPIDEIRSCLKDYGMPMETDKLCDILAHLPKNSIVTILSSNLEFVRNSKGEYFHADVMSFSDEELENIAEIIDDSIRAYEFMSGTELVRAIKAKYPYTYDAYSSYSDIAWRDALKYKLGSRFSFEGNIISAAGSQLTMSDVFGKLAAKADRLTMDELVNFSEQMGTVIYFDAVYDNALRVSENLFVSKKYARFQVKEIDRMLDNFVTGSYLPLKEVTNFGIFPEVGFPWNVYLLESYLASYSEKYTLIHSSYNRTCALGAIVKRSVGYQNWDSLVVDVLADSKIDLNKTEALGYLMENGYIARRSYTGIEGLLSYANAKRQTERRM